MAKRAQASRLDDFLARPERAVWIVALPMMAAFSAHALYIVFDQAFIGQLGPAHLAASTFVAALFFGVMALNIGFTTGVTAAVAQAVGRRDRDGANRTATNAIVVGLFLGALLAGLGWTFGLRIIPWLGADGVTITLAWQYFRILCMGMLFMFVSGAIRATLTGEGDARTPMTVALASTFINLGLDPIFIFVMEWGIAGAAYATVVAQIFTFVSLCYIAFVKRHSYVAFKLARGYLRPRMRLVAPVVRIGLPAAVGQLVLSLGSMFFNRILSGFGQTAVAGYGAGSKVDTIVALPIIALSSAVLSIVGMFGGANRTDLVRKVVLYTYKSVMLITMVIGLLAFFASTWIVSQFTEDPHALEVGRVYLRYIVFAYPLMAFGITSGRILQGLGYGIPTLVINAVRVLVIGVPASYVAVALLGAPIQSVWLSMIAGAVVADILAFIWIRHFIWKEKPAILTPSTPPDMP
jgi:putative MATE family efflux protein